MNATINAYTTSMVAKYFNGILSNSGKFRGAKANRKS